MVMASVAYAFLESRAGGAVDHRADIYSLGRHRIGYPPRRRRTRNPVV